MNRFLMRAVPVRRSGLTLSLFAALAVLAAGCGQTGSDAKNSDKEKAPKAAAAGKGGEKEVAKAGDGGDHAGWWCDEHGLPEAACDLCSKKFREAEKAKGNWCEHNRVKTSCFKCNPGLKEKYAAEYKAKFGKEPPASEDDEKKDDGKGKDKK